jgi:hypothetical protein
MENKTGKYFKYAIGEIILVVIGILIALQINNWNENRKENRKAKSYLINIKEDLILDTIQYSNAVKHIEFSIDKATKLLRLKSFEAYEADSLLNLIPNTYYQYSINSQTFDKLINSGVTELSNHNEIFDLINVYYTKQKNAFKSVRDWDMEETKKDNENIFNSSSFEIHSTNDDVFSDQFFYLQTPLQRQKELSKLLLSVKTRNRLRNALYRKKRVAFTFDKTKTEAKKIITKISYKLND